MRGLNVNIYLGTSMGCTKLTYQKNHFLEIIHSKKRASKEIKRINYYPFGLKHKGYNNVSTSSNIALKYKYNGVELEEGLDLNLYEMDMRQYDPAIARWTSIDPVIHYSYSTYNAFDNNPVFWADPSGADAIVKNKDDVTFTGADAIDAFKIIQNSVTSSDENDSANSNSDSSEECCGESIGRANLKTNPTEKAYLDRNPEIASVIYKSAYKAGMKAKMVTGEKYGGGENGYGDGMRHAYWMYLITKELGPKIALMYGDLHEGVDVGVRSSSKAGRMDQDNNRWGIRFAMKNISLSLGNNFEHYYDDAVRSGEITVNKRRTIPTEPLRKKFKRLNDKYLGQWYPGGVYFRE